MIVARIILMKSFKICFEGKLSSSSRVLQWMPGRLNQNSETTMWGIVPAAEFISYLRELTTKENNNEKQKDDQ